MQILEHIFLKKTYCKRILQLSGHGLKVIFSYHRNYTLWEEPECLREPELQHMFTQRKTIKELKFIGHIPDTLTIVE